MIGSLGSGRIEIDWSRQAPHVTISGGQCSNRSKTAVICSGSNLSFSVMDGTFKAILSGNNLHASLVGHGSVSAKGAGSTVVDGSSTVPWSGRGSKTVSI